MTILHYVLIALGGLFALFGIVALIVGAQYVFRGNPVERVRVIPDEDEGGEATSHAHPHFCRQLELHVETDLEPGSHVEVLFNGEQVYPRLWEDLRGAQRLITWHVYWFKPSSLADTLKQILIERARAGVEVLFLYDQFGASGTSTDYFDALRDAGVEVHRFRGVKWNTVYKAQKRSHIRAVVIDGSVGYTGGFGIHDDWRGDGRHEGQWRDTSVRLRGPVVHQLQSAFAADWTEATGELLVGDGLFPPEVGELDGPHHAGVVLGTPSIGSTDMERYLALSIFGARETLYITNAYFVPDDDFRHLLCEAKERNVDVRVLTPGANSDQTSTWYAGRAHYEQLLEAGVRIYEYRPTMVHAKTLVADGIWSAVGTVNFDNRSLSLNDEVTLLVYDREVAARLHDQFLEDLELADELSLEEFRERGAWARAKEYFWVIWSRLL